MLAGGFILSAFSPNVPFLIFSYGIVVGKTEKTQSPSQISMNSSEPRILVSSENQVPERSEQEQEPLQHLCHETTFTKPTAAKS